MIGIPEQILGLSKELWIGAILGTIISFIFWVMVSLARKAHLWFKTSRPRMLILGDMANDEEKCLIFIRHLYIQNVSLTTPLLEDVPRLGTGHVPNVRDLWADVDGTALADILNVLGQVGKKRNIRIIRMSEDQGEWNGHIIVIGGQSHKSYDFYALMEQVFYKMNNKDILDATGGIIDRQSGFGYGVILKARNPKRTGKPGVAFLIGGFGTLGTEAASYYLREHLDELGKDFGRHCFGIVVRASISAGVESIERLHEYDKVER